MIYKDVPVEVVSEGKYGNLTKKEYQEKVKYQELFEKANDAKSFKGWLTGRIRVADHEKNDEMVKLLEAIKQKYNEYELIRNLPVIEIEILDGWKGVDTIAIYDGLTNDFVISSHRKDKETGDVTTLNVKVPHENVNRILWFLKKWKVGDKHKCYDFAEPLGFRDWKDLWKNRDEYFMRYYWPIKVLESLKVIKYGGRGEVTRLK